MSRPLRYPSLALLVALVLSALLMAPSANAATTRSITIAANPTAALAGSKITISGKVTKTPQGANVKIQRKVGKKWKTVTTVKAKSAGKYSGKVTLKSTPGYYKYRAVATAFEGLKKARSKSVTVAALRKTSFFKVSNNDFLMQSTGSGNPGSADGSLSKPFTVGAKVVLQRKDAGVWTTISTGKIAANGTFHLPFPNAKSGEHRVYVSRQGLNAGVMSKVESFVFV
ncbi:hypothetical protein ABIE44_002396 [Marmoricola sp. OAE513]|uniref:hypothetical protein n=1 Tax=Marmoricola sp. OAE513 TaxID=2817894 RepID=UPI001AE22057